MNELALYAGGGGGLLASQWLLGWTTVCYVEIGQYAAEILIQRIRDQFLDDAPIWDDARSFDGRPWRGVVDCVSAGFPCQPFSMAGKRQGADDERNLWPETIRIIREVRPEWVFLENVPELRCPRKQDRNTTIGPSYFGTVLGDLAESGFDARWDVLSARALGANHWRRRLWIVAHARGTERGARVAEVVSNGWRDSQTFRRKQGAVGFLGSTALAPDPYFLRRDEGREHALHAGQSGAFAGDPAASGAEGSRLPQRQAADEGTTGNDQRRGLECCLDARGWWADGTSEPGLCGVDDGLAHRMDRIRALGKGQVPAVAWLAWLLLSQGLIECP